MLEEVHYGEDFQRQAQQQRGVVYGKLRWKVPGRESGGAETFRRDENRWSELSLGERSLEGGLSQEQESDTLYD